MKRILKNVNNCHYCHYYSPIYLQDMFFRYTIALSSEIDMKGLVGRGYFNLLPRNTM